MMIDCVIVVGGRDGGRGPTMRRGSTEGSTQVWTLPQ
jgi:hypothetical protein